MFEYPYIDPQLEDGSLKPLTPREQQTIDRLSAAVLAVAIAVLAGLMILSWVDPEWMRLGLGQ